MILKREFNGLLPFWRGSVPSVPPNFFAESFFGSSPKIFG